MKVFFILVLLLLSILVIPTGMILTAKHKDFSILLTSLFMSAILITLATVLTNKLNRSIN